MARSQAKPKQRIAHWANNYFVHTGKFFSEALILASTNQQYDKRFIELRVQYMKITSSEHVVYVNCSECQNKKTIYVPNMF